MPKEAKPRVHPKPDDEESTASKKIKRKKPAPESAVKAEKREALLVDEITKLFALKPKIATSSLASLRAYMELPKEFRRKTQIKDALEELGKLSHHDLNINVILEKIKMLTPKGA